MRRGLVVIVSAGVAALEFIIVWAAFTVMVAKTWAEQPGHVNGFDGAAKSHALTNALIVWAALLAIQFAVLVMISERRRGYSAAACGNSAARS